MAWSRYSTGICLEGLRKGVNLDQGSRCPCWDSSRVPPRYISGAHPLYQVNGFEGLSCDIFDIPGINCCSHVHSLKRRTYFGTSSSNWYLKQRGSTNFLLRNCDVFTTYAYSIADSLCPNQQTNRLYTELMIEPSVWTPSQNLVINQFHPSSALEILFSSNCS
jgi:hypothetical protein